MTRLRKENLFGAKKVSLHPSHTRPSLLPMQAIGHFLLALLVSLPIGSPSLAEGERAGSAVPDWLRREPIDLVHDIPYADDGNPRHRLDLYLPRSRSERKLPVLVFFHGGGWRGGDKRQGAGRLAPFVKSGEFAGVSVAYRLSREAVWPAQFHDAKAAVRWVRANAERYGLDPERICAWGASAGAHIALMIGMTGDSPELEGSRDGLSSKVSCVANYFGITEMLAIIGQPGKVDRTKPTAPEAMLIGGPLSERREQAIHASPITYVSEGDPPVFTAHGDADMIVPYDQAVRLHAALVKKRISSYLVTVKGAGHGGFPKEVNERLADFFAKYLLGRELAISTSDIEAGGG